MKHGYKENKNDHTSENNIFKIRLFINPPRTSTISYADNEK